MLNLNLKMTLTDAIKYIKDGQVDDIIKKSLMDVVHYSTITINDAVKLFVIDLMDSNNDNFFTFDGSLDEKEYLNLSKAEKLLNNTLALQVQCIYMDITRANL